jgi:hypothetical protein
MGRLRVRAIMPNGTCIAGYADTGTQPSCVNRLVPAALGRDDETASDFIGVGDELGGLSVGGDVPAQQHPADLAEAGCIKDPAAPL